MAGGGKEEEEDKGPAQEGERAFGKMCWRRVPCVVRMPRRETIGLHGFRRSNLKREALSLRERSSPPYVRVMVCFVKMDTRGYSYTCTRARFYP